MVICRWSEWISPCAIFTTINLSAVLNFPVTSVTIVVPHINSLNTWRWKEISLTCANALPKTNVCSVDAHNRMCCHWLCASCLSVAIGQPFTVIWRILVFTPSFHQSLPCTDVCSPYWFLLSHWQWLINWRGSAVWTDFTIKNEAHSGKFVHAPTITCSGETGINNDLMLIPNIP